MPVLHCPCAMKISIDRKGKYFCIGLFACIVTFILGVSIGGGNSQVIMYDTYKTTLSPTSPPTTLTTLTTLEQNNNPSSSSSSANMQSHVMLMIWMTITTLFSMFS